MGPVQNCHWCAVSDSDSTRATNPMPPPENVLTGRLSVFTSTCAVHFPDVAFSEITLAPADITLTRDILAVNSNFGHVAREDARAHVKPPNPPAHAPGTRIPYRQGDASCFNSCLEISVGVPAEVAARLPPAKKKYSTKLFRTGKAQVPGSLLEGSEDARAVVERLAEFIEANPGVRETRVAPNPAIDFPPGRYPAPVLYVPVDEIAERPADAPPLEVPPFEGSVIENFKTAVNVPNNAVINFQGLADYLRSVPEAPPAPLLPIRECVITGNCTPKLKFAFVIPADEPGAPPITSVLINIYKRGKINVLGINENKKVFVPRIMEAVRAVFEACWDEAVTVLPAPDDD